MDLSFPSGTYRASHPAQRCFVLRNPAEGAGKPDQSFYANEIARWAQVGKGSLMRELKRNAARPLLQVAFTHAVLATDNETDIANQKPRTARLFRFQPARTLITAGMMPRGLADRLSQMHRSHAIGAWHESRPRR